MPLDYPSSDLHPSRTAASILWRLDHGQLQFSLRSVLVLDEAGMADDVTTLRLLSAAKRAGAKVVIVGDDRQLPSIGAGGAMGAVLERHPEAAHLLAENVRQRDVAERDALAQLRAGKVAEAVDWYVANGRIVVKPTIEEARKPWSPAGPETSLRRSWEEARMTTSPCSPGGG